MALQLRPMTDAEYTRWRVTDDEAYVQERMRSGEPEEVARRLAAAQIEQLFPGGQPGPGHQLLTIERDGVAIGTLWVGPHPQRPERAESGGLYNIDIESSERGHGLGRTALAMLERRLHDEGYSELSLNVFGHNVVARHLYTSSGYTEAAIVMTKALG